MHLTKLEISGFKSFAQRAILEFSPGSKNRKSITAIVGPNGSGKSNIADAIRWVMGEQSLKQLRGKKSTDIIFAGSEAKGQLGMASVSMTIDNADGRAAIEYDELIITRRLYRSGESEYLINENPVRLLDIQLLLAKAQFGQGSYGVIGQGMIDRLLLQSTEERKDFFDEAAGIKEFQIKRHQAALKLARSKEHIAQADMLLGEIEPRLKLLSRQVKKLDERKEMEISLREMQETYYGTMWKKNEEQLIILKKELQARSSEYDTIAAELTHIQFELAHLAKEASRQDIFFALQKRYQEAVQQKNNLEKERAILQGKMQIEYSRAGKQNVGWLENKIETLSQDVTGLLSEEKTIRADSDRTEVRIHERQKQIESAELSRAQLRGTLATLRERLSQAQSEESYMHLTGLTAVQAVFGERQRLGTIYGILAQLGTVEDKYQTALDVAAGSHMSSVIVADDDVAERCIHFLRQEQMGVATFLPLNKIKPRFIPQDVRGYIGMSGVCGFALDLVKYDKKFEHIFSYVLGSTLIVDSIATARRIGIGRVRMVTLDGDVLETSGSMKGGYRRIGGRSLSFANTTTVFGYGDAKVKEKEIRDGEQELIEIEKRMDTLAQELRTDQATLDLLRNKQTMLQNKKQDQEKERAALEQELSLTGMSKEEYGSIMSSLASEKIEFEKQITAAEKQVLTIQREMESFNEEEEKKKQRVFALQEEMQKTQSSLNGIGEIKNIHHVEIAKFETKQEDIESEAYQELHASLHSILGRIEPLGSTEELGSVQEHIQKLKYSLSLIGGIDQAVVEEHAQTKERYDALAAELTDLQETMANLEELIVELDEMMKKKRNKAFKEIRKEFDRYFSLLFEGGKADLIEVYSDEKGEEDGQGIEEQEEEVEEKKGPKMLKGIDIVACPPGKKIKNIQALSGGERTMTSIALMCAILHTNPPPFVVLDEVEAALDEANTLRFTTILQELAAQSQFILITHNRATMHAADALYGVTMGNEGMSHLLSVQLEDSKK